MRRVGESELLGGVWGGGWKKETLEGYSKAHSLNSHTDLYAFCHPPPLTCQSLVMFLLMTQRREASVLYAPIVTSQGTQVLCPNAPAPMRVRWSSLRSSNT